MKKKQDISLAKFRKKKNTASKRKKNITKRKLKKNR